MKKRNKNLVFWFASISIIFFGAFIINTLFFSKRIKEITLENSFLITEERQEIESQNRLKIEKDNHYISIMVEPPLEAFAVRNGIKTPEGEIANPEIYLIDEEGVEYLLTHSGSRRYEGNEFANYAYESGLPPKNKYTKIFLSSKIPVKAKKIIWSGYNSRDLK